MLELTGRAPPCHLHHRFPYLTLLSQVLFFARSAPALSCMPHHTSRPPCSSFNPPPMFQPPRSPPRRHQGSPSCARCLSRDCFPFRLASAFPAISSSTIDKCQQRYRALLAGPPPPLGRMSHVMSRDKRRPKCPSLHPSPLHSRVSLHTSPYSPCLQLTLLPQDTSCLTVPRSTAAPLPSSFSPSAGTQPLLNNHYTLKPLSYPPLRSHFMVPCQRAPQPDLLICPGRLRPATRMRACGGVSQTRVATGTRAAVSRGRYCAGDGSNAPDQGAGKKWRLAFARVVVLGSLTLLFPTLFASNHAFQKRTW